MAEQDMAYKFFLALLDKWRHNFYPPMSRQHACKVLLGEAQPNTQDITTINGVKVCENWRDYAKQMTEGSS